MDKKNIQFPPKDATITHGFDEAEKAALKSAESGPANPAEVREAFLDAEPLLCGDIELHPITLATYMFFEQLGSPFADPSADEPDSYRIAEAVYVLSRHIPTSRAIYKRGPEHWTDAVWEFANHIPATELRKLGTALREHMQKAFATLISDEQPGKSDAPGGEAAGKTETPSPECPPKATTASAGG